MTIDGRPGRKKCRSSARELWSTAIQSAGKLIVLTRNGDASTLTLPYGRGTIVFVEESRNGEGDAAADRPVQR